MAANRSMRILDQSSLASSRALLENLYEQLYGQVDVHGELHDAVFRLGEISLNGRLARLEMPVMGKKARLVTLAAKLNGGVSITGSRRCIEGIMSDPVYTLLLPSEQMQEQASFDVYNRTVCNLPSASLRPRLLCGVSIESVLDYTNGLNYAVMEVTPNVPSAHLPVIKLGGEGD